MNLGGRLGKTLVKVALFGVLWGAVATASPQARITVSATRTGRAENPRMWGLFIENILHDVDGGLYAQMIQNPDFQYEVPPADCKVVYRKQGKQNRTIVRWINNGRAVGPIAGSPLLAWKPVESGPSSVTLRVQKRKPLSAAHRLSLRVTVKHAGAGVANVGYWGMPIKQGRTYRVSFYARTPDAAGVNLRVGLANVSGTRHLSHVNVKITGIAWRRYKCSLRAAGTSYHGALTLTATVPATFDINLVLMFPVSPKTGKTEFMRPDLVALLQQLHPGFLRFPGGNYIEGQSLAESYNWRQTVGPMIDRPGHDNFWGYRDTDGFGYLGWLELAQRIGATPIYCTSAGMLHGDRSVPGTDLGVYVHEMLSAVAFANDSANTRWGALRARCGHAAPFHLRYVEIGNENGGPVYKHNYHVMAAALHKVFPKVIPIACDWGGVPSGHLDIVDQHFYARQQWFLTHVNLYDRYPRTGPKVLVGEYAAGTRTRNGDLRATLADAAFMLGMEHNCDVVRMASYGVTLDNAGPTTEATNLIKFNDNLAFGRSSYWVQYLFTHNQPAFIYTTRVRVTGVSTRHTKVHRFFSDAGVSANKHLLIVKVVNAAGYAMPTMIDLKGFTAVAGMGTAIILHEHNPGLDNTFNHPARAVPKATTFSGASSHFHYVFQPYSVTVLRLQVVPALRR